MPIQNYAARARVLPCNLCFLVAHCTMLACELEYFLPRLAPTQLRVAPVSYVADVYFPAQE